MPASPASAPPSGAGGENDVVYWILFYDLVDDYLERRAAFRDDHLGRARAAHERGEQVLAGALADPADGAALVFTGAPPAAAEAFARDDPYVANGLVSGSPVPSWSAGVGAAPAS